MGKKSQHIRFDDDGKEVSVKRCKTLNKVKNFLGRVEKNVKDVDKNEVPDILKTVDNVLADKCATERTEFENVANSDLCNATYTDNEISLIDDNSEEHSDDLLGDREAEQHLGAYSDSLYRRKCDRLNELNTGDQVDSGREAVTYDLDLWEDTEEMPANTGVRGCRNKNKSKKKRKSIKMPSEIAEDSELRKYWAQRYRLFSMFDEGIRLDRG